MSTRPIEPVERPPRARRRPAAVAAPPPVDRSRPRARDASKRRLAPAGEALLVIVIALSLSMFLNARGMRKTAHEQPAGTGRDVATGLTGALAGISGVFQLDEPRRGLQAALGRSG